MTRFVLRSLLFIGLVSAGCATTEEMGPGGETPGSGRLNDGRVLAERAPSVASVQLYRAGNEASLPILPQESGERLTLAFDLIGSDARPLSVWFYHADRTWRRDLMAAEALRGFDHDDLFDYTHSRGTQSRYVHYRYELPSPNVSFRVSGNYVLRVTEQGQEEAVLFERRFWVAEQSVPVEFVLDPVMVAGSAFSALQPTVVFTPGGSGASSAFDYAVCFMQDGRIETARCVERPTLTASPALQYYLEPEDSFGPMPGDHFLDLSDLRTGSRIQEVDRSATPIGVVLEPDYIRFPGASGAPLLHGNPVIDAAVRDVLEPRVSAEYVRVRFSLVPDGERPVPGAVYVIGPFSDWRADEFARMTWNPEAARYEADVVLKQGQYEYRYGFEDRHVAREVEANTMPRMDHVISALVYLGDLHAGTDRLISALSMTTR